MKYLAIKQETILWRRPLEKIEELSICTRRKYTQVYVSKEEPSLQYIREKGSFYFVKKYDDTYGWIKKEHVKIANEPLLSEFWQKNKKALKRKVLILNCNDAKVRSFLRKYKNTPYLWGGVSKKGIDCSGFVQRFFLEIFNIVLPKHSGDQKKYGLKLKKEKIVDYSLVFFEHKKTGISHVGICYKDKIFHVCLDKKGMTSEDLIELEKKYKYKTAKQIIECLYE